MSRLARLLLVLLLIAGAVWAAVERPWASPPRTVVLISIDTLRPDRLGVYGNAPDVSPHIDALAKDGVVFEQALALSPWTLPSHMTMLTGLDPMAHGVHRAGYTLSTRVTTLAEALRSAGFRTAAFTDGGFVSHVSGMGQGFEIYRDEPNPETMVNGFARILPEALEWMRSTRHEDSFVFLHTFDVHTPYQVGDQDVLARFHVREVPSGADDYLLHRFGFLYQQQNQRISDYGRMSEVLRDYDAGVHEADTGVGAVLDLLEETGRLKNALVIVTSDHGESFGDHGVLVGHGLALTDDEIAVPLLIRFPNGEGRGQRIDTLVDLSDLAPTALEAMGVPAPPEMQGESLLGLLRHRARRRDWVFGVSQNLESCFLVRDGFKFISPPALDSMEAAKRHLAPTNPTGYREKSGEEYQLTLKGEVITLRYDTERDPLGLRDVLPDSAQLYDRANDPAERNNLYKQEPDRVKAMAKVTGEIYERSNQLHADLDDGQSQTQRVDPHTQQQIEQLGYIGAASPQAAQAIFSNLPRDLKEQAKLPWMAPDTSKLDEVDRDVHTVRLAIAERSIEPAEAQAKLQQLGNRYLKWLKENGYPARVAWRFEDLEELARSAGVEVDVERWKGLLDATKPR